MPTSSSIREARLALGQQLRALRQQHGLTARELARRCDWHESKCSRIENGHIAASPKDIRAWTAACGDQAAAAELIDIARGIDGMYVEWRAMEKAGLKRAQESVLPLWDQTRLFKAYAQNLIPGPLQTRAYTRAVLAGIRERRGLLDDVEAAVATRMDKQKVLTERSKRFEIVLEESVLYRRVGPHEVMVEQLSRLLEASVLASVRLGIIPMGADRGLMPPVEDFWVFDDRQVNVELVSAYLTVKQRGEVERYLDGFSRLNDLAHSGGPALTLIAAAIANYARSPGTSGRAGPPSEQ
ncbi:helix-turn-helix transcriptional regulator [Streptomyces sp. NPDC047017]|uniref:helix-turn-helix domain-containing protein n=1 Tax=Streptomyces sp. NPDC047017 TaxID=3155024 RepID=UPI0033FA2401